MQSIGKFFQCSLDDRKYFIMWWIRLGLFLSVFFVLHTPVSNRWLPRIYTLVDSSEHAVATALLSYSIIKLCDTGKECLKKLGNWLIADRLGDGVQGYSVGGQYFSYGEVVIGISGKPIHSQNHKGLDLIFIFSTEFQRIEKFLAVLKAQIFCALAFLPKN